MPACGKYGITQGRCDGWRTDFPHTAYHLTTLDKMDLNARRSSHTHHPVIGKITLHDPAFIDTDITVQGRAQAVDDAAFDLVPGNGGINDFAGSTAATTFSTRSLSPEMATCTACATIEP